MRELSFISSICFWRRFIRCFDAVDFCFNVNKINKQALLIEMEKVKFDTSKLCLLRNKQNTNKFFSLLFFLIAFLCVFFFFFSLVVVHEIRLDCFLLNFPCMVHLIWRNNKTMGKTSYQCECVDGFFSINRMNALWIFE